MSLFVWHLLHNRLPTQANLLRRNILPATNSLCVFGCEVLETGWHLFLECETSINLWSHVWQWLGLSSESPCELCDHHLQFSYMAGLPRCTQSFLKGIWFACAWVIWKDQNNRIFKNAALHLYVLIEKVKLNFFFYGWKQSNHLLIIVIMIGGNTRSYVWVFTRNLFSLVLGGASIYLAPELCKFWLLIHF